ncbi:MAG: MGMT family protein, partial [Chthoniobacterales bacterium]
GGSRCPHRDWLCNAIAPGRRDPPGPPLKTEHSIPPFAARVYAALQGIPRGRVITYAALARRVGCRSPRAVGQALRANPFAPKVPCHRVIASDLTPGGFVGKTNGPELRRKLSLLAAEGVKFADGRVTDPRRVIR